MIKKEADEILNYEDLTV